MCCIQHCSINRIFYGCKFYLFDSVTGVIIIASSCGMQAMVLTNKLTGEHIGAFNGLIPRNFPLESGMTQVARNIILNDC